LLWGGSLLVTGAVFSFAHGIIHPYYSIAIAPAIGALVGAGSVELWRRRGSLSARLLLAGALAATVAWAYVLLDRSPDWDPGLRLMILAAGLGASVLIVAGPLLKRPLATAVAALALVAALAGPAAYTLQTVTTSHSGAIPSAGPTVVAAGLGPGGNANGGGFRQRPGGAGFTPPQGGLGGGPGGFAGGGNFLQASQVSAELAGVLEADANRYRWIVATIDANSAAGYELATGDAVMAIGGFNGSDPAPTLAQFQDYVSKGQIHYFIAGGMRGSGGGSGSQIAAWVSQNFTATTLGEVTIYDLTNPGS
jgi:4-amino-4-deoxy-L-arabinose transferase-like glycosyltransferase